MNTEVKETTEIPAALPISDAEVEREKLLDQVDDYQTTDDKLISEAEDDDEFDEIDNEIVKPSKKKLFLAFVGFVFGFVLLVGLMSWFFGIGVFAKSKTQAVDRTTKIGSGSTTTAPASEEEKLKMALNLVAEKESDGQTDLSNTNAEDNDPEILEPDFNSSVDIPSTKATDVTEALIIPDAVSQKSADANQTKSNSPVTENYSGRNTFTPSKRENSPSSVISKPVTNKPVNTKSTDSSLGRSLFFGVERKEKAVAKVENLINGQNITTVRNENTRKISRSAIPFGTLLPVRILGAVYTLRSSGGLVRMELTRKVSGKNYSYPAGTVLVGNVRGSEYKRAFISVIGLIDPKTGGLIKLKGEVMGTDGASGVVGRRRKVKSVWSRVLGGLREAGAMALGTISGRRSGGTVIISDSVSKASGTLTDELSGLVGNKGQRGEFVEIPAGTLCFVQITDLPNEVSDTANYSQNKFAATGLDADELADLLSSGSPEKIRALMPRMTPEFRRVAEKVLSYQR